MDYSIQRSWSIEDTLSWFIPDKKGRHDTKFGARYSRTWLSNPNWSNMNGTYVFRNYQDRPFNPADPRSYPERLTIRVPDALTYELVMHVYEIFAQDKWQLTPGMTRQPRPALRPRGDAARGGSGQSARSAIRRSIRSTRTTSRRGSASSGIPTARESRRCAPATASSTTRRCSAPSTTSSPTRSTRRPSTRTSRRLVPTSGHANGQFPTESGAARRNRVDQLTPAVRAYINSHYPPGTRVRNTGTVTWDDPEREQPYFHQISVGYEREIFSGVSASVDYVRMLGRDMFLNPNLNIPTGTNTIRDGPRVVHRSVSAS